VSRSEDGGLSGDPFDVDAFLARPITAHLATNGPTVRPVWYLWEDGAFWILTGPWSHLAAVLTRDPRVALSVDTCDLATGEVLKVLAAGDAEVVPYDEERARRKLRRYLGPHESWWEDEWLRREPVAEGFIRLVPDRLVVRDHSFRVAARMGAMESGDA
jgi:nitroimidazol reductase NimA-like FMN-containing flavoprotein (pyridoxamine 5'-phosphate oxidase superfamily)